MSNSYDTLLRQPSLSSKLQDRPSEAQPLLKRKRDQETLSTQHDEVFTIQPCSVNGTSQPLSAAIMCILLRSQLPLHYLDTSELPSRFFKSRSESLDHAFNAAREDDCQPVVLVVQNQVDDIFYAIEQIGSRVYSLCKIGIWVSRKTIEAAGCLTQIGSSTAVFQQRDIADVCWWKNVAVKQPDDASTGGSRKCPRLDMIRDDTVSDKPQEVILTSTTPPGLRPDDPPLVDDLPPVEEVLEQFLSSYLDALYVSKMSLAYFAKGPVSRLRARFSQADSHGFEECATFLRSLVLQSTLADKKFRETLPNLLPDLPPSRPSDVEASGTKPKKGKKRKRKFKLDKTGLLPDERDFFAQWYHNDETANLAISSGESREQNFKRRSLKLRTREAFMQAILMLEILALETSSEHKVRPSEQTMHSGMPLEASDTAQKISQSSKIKAKQDIGVALELLLDKLSIWYSLDQGPIEQSASKPDAAGKAIDHTLRDFCIEVAVPFYASRASHHCTIVNTKLGGPVAQSAARAKPKARISGEQQAKERSRKEPRDPLQRVSSEIMNHPKRIIPTLSRAATVSGTVSNLKREGSEVRLFDVPQHAGHAAPFKRHSALEKMRLKQREVDLDALSQLQEAKKKKQAEVDAKLKEAISALKKPNRTLAGKEIADKADTRGLKSRTKARGPVRPEGKRSQSQTQVEATPKHKRFSEPSMVVASTPQHQRMQTHGQDSDTSVSFVPSSSMQTTRAPLEHADIVPSTGHRDRHIDVEATPSRPGDVSADGFVPPWSIRPFSLAASNRKVMSQSSGESGLRRGGGALEPFASSSDIAVVESTPIKANDHPQDKRSTAAGRLVEGSVGGRGKAHDLDEETNIYDALGWND